MTDSKIKRFRFAQEELSEYELVDTKLSNWPVVYIINNAQAVYVGETRNAQARMEQHLKSDVKKNLDVVRIVLDDTFNKSVCLDLESYLIQLFSGDGKYKVLNANAGITNADYFDRETYKRTFDGLVDHLRLHENLFDQTIPEIENSDLFKLSPYKALNQDQKGVVVDIVEGLLEDLEKQEPSTVVVEGNPGTGKTVVAIYLLKLLEDIRAFDYEHPVLAEDSAQEDSSFSQFFTPGHGEILEDTRIGFVVPMQSLRKSVEQVFRKIPGLERIEVLSPFDVGEVPPGKNDEPPFDLLVVDETHRLNQLANQPSGVQNKRFNAINAELMNDQYASQLDWIVKQSRHRVLMLDSGQSVRPADLPEETIEELLASLERPSYRLRTQMRVAADADYVGYIRKVLANDQFVEPENFGEYDLRFYDNFGEMRDEILRLNNDLGVELCRVIAGYAWKWKSKKNKQAIDIELDGVQVQWNRTATDWINSNGSELEVGSIHTVQGYDLNYAGVVIGKDLRFDPGRKQIYFDRDEYKDSAGLWNNDRLKIKYSDDDVLRYIQNIYGVLLTRGILGTFVYVCDPALREYLRPFFSHGSSSEDDQRYPNAPLC